MKRSLVLSSCALSAGLLVCTIPAAALAVPAAQLAPAAPVVTSSIAGDKATLTITGEPGATATVFGDDHRSVAGTPLTNGTARVVVPAPRGVTSTFAVSQSTSAGASSSETTTVVSDGNSTALKPVELLYTYAQDSEVGTIAQLLLSGAPHAITKVTNKEGTVLAVASLGKEGQTLMFIEGLSHGATDVAITQTLGFAASAPVEKTLVGELVSTQIADTGSKVFYDIAGAPYGDAVVLDADGKEIARTAITREGNYLAVPHTADKPETISLHRAINGVLSPGWTTTLSGSASQLQPPRLTHDADDDTDDMFGVRIMKDPGVAARSLRGGTVTITNISNEAEASFPVPTSFEGNSKLVYIPKPAFGSGSPIIVHQVFEGITSNWTYLKL